MRKILISTILLLITFLHSYAQLENIPLVSCIGESMVKVVPDEIELAIHFGSSVSSETIRSQGYRNFYDNVSLQLKLGGGSSEEIDETMLFIKKYEDGRVLKKNVIIAISDIPKYEAILERLLQEEELYVLYTKFRVKSPMLYKEQARKQAVENAKVKATNLSQALGQKIGKAHLIEEIPVENYNWYSNELDDVITKEIYSDIYNRKAGYLCFPAKVKVSFDLLK